jgi:hypothetical protein
VPSSRVSLVDLLTLVGHLDDAPGAETARDRFRHFVTTRIAGVAGVRDLLRQCQESLGDQPARARQDLVVALGRFLGFDVAFGPYARAGAEAPAGQWTSRAGVQLVIEVRSERTLDTDVTGLARSLAAMGARHDGPHWMGLMVLTPFYVLRRPLEVILARREPRDIRSVSMESLLWLAEATGAGRLEHEEVLRILTAGPDSNFMIDLMRRLSTRRSPPPVGIAAAPAPAAMPGPPRLTIVSRTEAEPGRYWAAILTPDEAATPEQMLQQVVRLRRVIGVSRDGGTHAEARIGDRICLIVPGTGVAGHAVLAAAIAESAGIIRGADRFGAVFRLSDVVIYEAPHPVRALEAHRILGRLPVSATGALLRAISGDEYETLTGRADDDRSAII